MGGHDRAVLLFGSLPLKEQAKLPNEIKEKIGYFDHLAIKERRKVLSEKTLFKNKKTGKVYKKITLATDCSDGKRNATMVVYHSIKDKRKLVTLTMDQDEFLEKYVAVNSQ